MKNAVLWWLSLGLISISFAESTPLLALFLSGFGGAIVGKCRYSSPLKNGLEKVNYQRSLIFTFGAALFAAVVYFYFDLLHGNPFVILSLFSLLLFSWLVLQKTISIVEVVFKNKLTVIVVDVLNVQKKHVVFVVVPKDLTNLVIEYVFVIHAL